MYQSIKFLFDFCLALLAIVFLFPVFVLLSLMVIAFLGTPIFFTQKRVGKNNKIFEIIKFRTMLAPSPERQTDSERLTGFGRFLRSTSLDELPELWNVLRGEMSLVGPRPLLIQYLPLYSKEQARRHEVRPGITGWAQVNGRNALSWEDKFKYDVWYVDNQSFWLDMKILVMTFYKVFKREDISAEGEATAPFFTGNKAQKDGEEEK